MTARKVRSRNFTDSGLESLPHMSRSGRWAVGTSNGIGLPPEGKWGGRQFRQTFMLAMPARENGTLVARNPAR
jgi:hypothetical protein